MYVKIRRHQHSRVRHAHTGPAGRQVFRRGINLSLPSSAIWWSGSSSSGHITSPNTTPQSGSERSSVCVFPNIFDFGVYDKKAKKKKKKKKKLDQPGFEAFLLAKTLLFF